jgi:hypothetical protein
MPSARNLTLVLLLALAVAAGLWHSAGRTSVRRPEATSTTQEVSSPAEHLALLENGFRALRDGERDAPRDRWDPRYVVQRIGTDPDSLAAWVRSRTSWIPYRGVLRGPVGVLMDRQGNSLDRSLLLAALLAEAGHKARLAHADLPAERASELLPGLVAQRSLAALAEFASIGSDSLRVGDIAARYKLDGPEIERVLNAYETGTMRLLTDLDRRVPDQAAQLISSLAAPDPAAEWRIRRDTALAALSDHWWVQVQSAGSWMDLDVLDGGARGDYLVPQETISPSELAPTLHHEVAIRVIAERVVGGRLTEQPTLAHTIWPSELIGRAIVLQFWPAAWPNQAPVVEDLGRSTRQLASGQDTWNAALVIGNDVVASGQLTAASSAAPAPGLGGLGGAITQGLGSRNAPTSGDRDSLLTAVWIEYQLDVPGRAPRVIRRAVFDLVGEAARHAWTPRIPALSEGQRLTRALSLMMRTEILPVVSEVAPEFVLHLHGSSLLANDALVRAVSREGFGSDQRAADSLLRLAQPGVSPLYTLAVLRTDAIGQTRLVDRPALFTRHQYPKAQGEDLSLEDAIDIVANESGIALTEDDGFAARLEQGVWDTNLEGFLAGSRVSTNTAFAYAATGGWRTLTSAQSAHDSSGIAPDAAALMRRDLEAGYIVVAPADSIVLQGEGFDGWWRIDPATGDALGIAGMGWGQAAPDYTLHLAAFVEMAKPFVFTYALCQYIPQAANSLNILGNEFWRRGLSPSDLIGVKADWITRPAEGKDFEDVAVENNRRCVIEAIIGGFVATAPLLLRIMTTRQSVLAAELRGSRVGPGAFRTRPSMRGAPPIKLRNPGRAPPIPGRGPAGTLPSGRTPPANPLGGTEPGLRPSRPGGPPSKPTPPAATTGAREAALAAEARAQQNFDKAMRDYYQQINNWIEAKSANPGMGANERQAYDRMVRNAERAAWERGQELESATNAAKPYNRPQPTGLPPCPPNCGNERATMDAENQLQQSGIGTSFWKITWPR